MTRRIFTLAIAYVTVLFSGCETSWDYGSINNGYPNNYKFSPQQQRTAEMQVRRYEGAVKRGKRAAARQRYIAVQTLDPDRKQLEAYTKQREAQQKFDETQGRSLSPELVQPHRRGGELFCELDGDTVSIGGSAVTYFQGQITLPN